MKSLRGRLLLASVAGIALASLLAAWLLGAAFQRAALGSFDRRLADDLVTVAGVIARDGDGSVRLRREPADGRYARVFSGHYWQVGDGPQAFRSRSLWDHLPVLPPMPATGAVEYGELSGPRGQRLRSAQRRVQLPGASAPVRVWVASDQAILDTEVAQFRWLAGVTFAVLAAGLSLAAAAQVHFGLQPLRGITQRLQRVRSGENERLAVEPLPTEVQPLAEHLNQLLDHHERMVQRARQSGQDLAHALKTPLAVLDAEAQRPGAALADTVSEQVARMRAVVDRQLATSAPVDARQSCEVAPVVARLRDYLAAAHRDKALALSMSVPAALKFQGAADDLEEMLGNVLDNACKWARERVQVQGGQAGGRIWIEVGDDGPGLAPSLRAAALERGVRLDQRMPGTGLGLAIVQDIAASYGGALALDVAPLGGLSVRLELPAA
ncbi:sensor histidine kinase [Arenimonas sp. MALMAid1274]|uniref:sensor histidine kinase n=1 Tax=Arenimonas sp. MALMAid1274 TaxID=3411630 RepID=UPI003BA28F47